MKTREQKYLLALLMISLSLPTMAQDFLNIYFSDGTFRIFHFSNIEELKVTKVDAEGYAHIDYEYQYIQTKDEEFFYSLADIDSISFTKYDEQKAEENMKEAITTVMSELSDCETITDAAEKIEGIMQCDAVEKSWVGGNELFVKIEDGETISFFFDPARNLEFDYENASQALDAWIPVSPRRINNANGSKMKAVVANQQHHVDSDWRKMQREDYMYKLRDKLEEAGFEAVYEENPDLDFFYDELYDYDVVFLSTHGGYDGGEHGTITSQFFGLIPMNCSNEEWSEYRKTSKEEYDKIFSDPRFAGAEDYMYQTFKLDEKRIVDGQLREFYVSYAVVKESFFRYTVKEKFSNPRSFFFNAACQSLMGNNNLANILRSQRGLGTYVGYTQSNSYGQQAGCTMLMQMLDGESAEKAYAELNTHRLNSLWKRSSLDGTWKDEHYKEWNWLGITQEDYIASVKIVPEKGDITPYRYIIPVVTKPLTHEEVMNDYNNDGSVVVMAITTALDPLKLWMGFCYGTDREKLNEKVLSDTQFHVLDTGDGNYCLASALDNLERGKTYYYCGYTYDGENYNYGDTLSFTIDELADLQVSTQSLAMTIGEKTDFDITSGNGSYMVSSTREEVAIAELNDHTVTVTAVGPGNTYITVVDNLSGHQEMVEVIVAANLSLSVFGTVNLKQGDGVNVRIMSGNGKYSVRSTDERVAKAFIVGMFVSVQTHATGSAIIIVTDELTGQEASFTVCVTDLPAEATDLGLPSGTLWASYNVGATGPEDYGDYFAWGETEGKKDKYFWTTYKHCDGVSNSNHDIGQNISGTDYDVAHVRWGGDWRMPTVDEFKELVYKCSYAETTLNGVKVFSFTGPNGKSIYLPAAGYKFNANEQEIGSGASYWSASLTTSINYAHELNISGGNVLWDCYINRFAGLPVRPVKDSGQSSYEPLALESTDPVALVVGKETTIDITSGNDSYTVESSNPSVVSATLSAWTSLATGEGGKCIWLKALAVGMATITITDTWSQQTATLQVTITSDAKPVMEAVDLGLPSGTKWASCNVGATCPEEVGSYFAWGETEEKSSYSSDNYHVDIDLSVPYTDIAGTENDIAHVRWGGDWCMPTTFQQRELMNKCTSEWTTVNGVNGRRFIGPNGNSIFLPAAGMCFGDSLLYDGIYGYYWSSTQSADGTRQAYSFYITSKGRSWDNYSQLYYGLPIRPVHP